MIQVLVIFGIFIFLAIQVFKKNYTAFDVLIFITPMTHLYLNIGLNLFASQVFLLVLVLLLIVKILNKKRVKISFHNNFLLFYIAYVIVSTLIITSVFVPSFMDVGGGFLRQEGRFISQIIFLLLSFSIVIVAMNYIKNMEDVMRSIKIFLQSLVLLVVLGWIQYFIFNLTQVDIFPLGLNEEGENISGISVILDQIMFRMNSLCIEPKSLASQLAVGVMVLHAFNYYGIRFFKYDLWIKIAFVITIFSTLSTSGMVMLPLLYIIYKLIHFLHKQKMTKKSIVIVLILISVIFYYIFVNFELILSILDERILSRDIANEDYDGVVKNFLLDNLQYIFFGTGIGNVHNFSYPYIPSWGEHYMSGVIFVAKSGYLRILSENGLVGFILFSLSNVYIYLKLKYLIQKEKNKNTRAILKALKDILIITFMAYMARGYVLNLYLIVFGITNAIAYIEVKNKKRELL
jgi:O-antigen ligase